MSTIQFFSNTIIKQYFILMTMINTVSNKNAGGGWLCVKWRVLSIKLSLEKNWPTNRNKQENVDYNLNKRP